MIFQQKKKKSPAEESVCVEGKRLDRKIKILE
jgi:hypothetical protein